jgi:D-glycero-alpha-D-manno-heptose-7-phosphate kinase
VKGSVLRAEAPTRIDLAGGTLDIPPLYLFHEGALTVNIAVSLCARVTLRPQAGRRVTVISRDQEQEASWPSVEAIDWAEKPYVELAARLIRLFAPKGGIVIETDCQAPAGAGTGGSSALGIALASALARLTGRSIEKPTLIEWTKGIETQTIRVPTGYQDYYAAAYGGLSVIRYGPEGVRREALGDARFLGEMERHLFLVYTGKPRFSGANNWTLFKRHIDGDRILQRFFDRLRDHALAMAEAIGRRDLKEVIRVFHADWLARRQMLPAMTTPAIDAFLRQAMLRGTLGGRLCGAGGGGCLALFIRPEARPRLTEFAERFGFRVLPCKIHRKGVTVRGEA